jgi:hypothetical protein
MIEAAYAWRTFWRERTFFLSIVITLASACALMTVVFSVVNAELWAPLPFRAPRQLVTVQATNPAAVPENTSLIDFLTLRNEARLTQFIAAEALTKECYAATSRNMCLSAPLARISFERSVQRLILVATSYRNMNTARASAS